MRRQKQIEDKQECYVLRVAEQHWKLNNIHTFEVIIQFVELCFHKNNDAGMRDNPTNDAGMTS